MARRDPGASEHDVAILGAGMLGAASAWALARAGMRVVVLEAGTPAGGATGNSFAWVNAVRKEPEAYHRLNAAGIPVYERLARELGETGYRGGGSLEWAEGAQQEELSARVARLGSYGYAAEWITREAALAREPGLAIPVGTAVAWYANDGWVDAPCLVARLLDLARQAGADVRTSTPVQSLRGRDGRVEAAATSHGDVRAAAFLVCVGPATEALLAPLGARIPVNRVPGILAVTSAPPLPLTRVVHAPGIHLRPDATGGLLLGATDLDPLVTGEMRAGAPPDFVHPLRERAARVFPAAGDTKILGVRIGVRPMPADGHTVAGPLPGFDNAWVIVTHSAVTMGPLLGELIAAEMTGGPPSPLLAPFRPARFASDGRDASHA